MKWGVTIPGQPWSGNHQNERNARGPGMHKRPEVVTYQDEIIYRVREARPSGWRPQGQIIVRYWFRVLRKVDCTNAIKVIEDAISKALDINDDLFLPRAMAKTTGVRPPYVEIELEDVE